MITMNMVDTDDDATPFQATAQGLVVYDGYPVNYEIWMEYGRSLRKVQGSLRWCIGDWLNYGELAYGEAYSQALNDWPDYALSSLQKCKYVAGTFPIAERRPGVTWSAHADVAKLPPAARSKWLDKLEAGMTREDLRLALNGHGSAEQHACPECGKMHRRKNES